VGGIWLQFGVCVVKWEKCPHKSAQDGNKTAAEDENACKMQPRGDETVLMKKQKFRNQYG
jgi:hypothetical protein